VFGVARVLPVWKRDFIRSKQTPFRNKLVKMDAANMLPDMARRQSSRSTFTPRHSHSSFSDVPHLRESCRHSSVEASDVVFSPPSSPGVVVSLGGGVGGGCGSLADVLLAVTPTTSALMVPSV